MPCFQRSLPGPLVQPRAPIPALPCADLDGQPLKPSLSALRPRTITPKAIARPEPILSLWEPVLGVFTVTGVDT